MFSTRRLAKRSIVGTRICAPWKDSRYYPGVIQSTQTWPNGEEVYSVLFDDGFSQTYRDNEIIGPGFQNITIATLKKGQKVFITNNGREISGVVIKHLIDKDDIFIDISSSTGEETEATRKLEDVRLIESRKSARLQDNDTDYSRLVDPNPEPTKKRTVSHVIDVPAHLKLSRRRRHSSPLADAEDDDRMMIDDDVAVKSSKISPTGPGSTSLAMDAHSAAMVLTALSCSPVSPGPFPATITDKGGSSPSATVGSVTGSSVASSGVWGMKSNSVSSTPSPPQYFSRSAPPEPPIFASRPGSSPQDEGIELDDSYFPDDTGVKKKRIATRTVFKCTWPGCGKLYNTCPSIESHVRHAHLGPKDDDEESDQEEEFYYTEIEVTVDTVTQTFADMHTSCTSPPPSDHNYMETTACLPDHDYQKKSAPLNIPRSSEHVEGFKYQGSSFPLTTSTGTGTMSGSLQFSFQGSPSIKVTKATDRAAFSSGSKSNFLSSSPKNSPMHKKSRSDIKKCRKVYGMESRDLWCTQCKWKKACTRFNDN